MRQVPMKPYHHVRPVIANGAFHTGFVPAIKYEHRITRPSPAFPMWLLLTAILLIPASLQVHLSGDGFKFTPGRAAIVLLFLPALWTFFRSSRKLVASDLFVLLTAAWMIGSRLPDDGLNPSAVAAVIEFLGGYAIGRAYFHGPQALKRFLRIFKILTFLVVMVAVLDQLFQQNIAETIVAMIMQTARKPVQFRFGIIRAASTIEMAELYGTFCCVAGSLFLFLEKNRVRRYSWAGLSFFGCVLALSSGPLLVFVIIVSFYAYEELFCQYAIRWKIINCLLLLFIALIFILSEHPFRWIISHMTLDPATGYFRLYVFDYVFDQISLAPFVGQGFGPIGDDEFLSTTTVDNVWLVCASRYGVPMIAFFFLTNLAAIARLRSTSRHGRTDPFMMRAATGFTQVLMTFMLVGLTVHFWNATWQLWAVCIGIRCSIKEWLQHDALRDVRSTKHGLRGSLYLSRTGPPKRTQVSLPAGLRRRPQPSSLHR
jgi:succinate dehydrogenase hydrophobic anchor subunit